MKLEPLDNRIVVKVDEADSETPGGILLPDSAKDVPVRGVVLAVGPGQRLANGKRSPIGLKVGDGVFFTKYGGSEVEIDGEVVTVLRENEIMAKVLV